MRALIVSFFSSAAGLLCYLLADYGLRHYSFGDTPLYDRMSRWKFFFKSTRDHSGEAEMLPAISPVIYEQRIIMTLIVSAIILGIWAFGMALLAGKLTGKRSLASRAVLLALITIVAPVYLLYQW
ncbi:hypothetical protein [Gynuella sunshinyii]|uniref:Uncharacterized protein n=1 Tax=Gynuella sunshinyii YC6258 TaxID=1445510 RepID=A0A0C5VD00_9GAMM|nr:hypothetical protein [Gynuella sunshinyii]AJQ92131.1 hypothetical Protein YC6258_00075 [Gynuella sunshinyii YC6258]